MVEATYAVDPKEAGVALGRPGFPTETGWKIVTPETWYFRNHQIADKIQTVEGYSDEDYYMDCTKVKLLCEVDREFPNASPGDQHAILLERYLETQNILIRPRELLVGNWGNDEHGIVFDALSDNWFAFKEFYDYGKAYYWENGEKLPVGEELYNDVERLCQKFNLVFIIKPYLDPMVYKMYAESGLRYWEIGGTTGFRAAPDYRWYMSNGLRKLVDMMKETIVRLEKEVDESTGKNFVDLSMRLNDCRASVRATEAVIKWIKRHGETAAELSKSESELRSLIHPAILYKSW